MRNRTRLFNLVKGQPRFEVTNLVDAGPAQMYLYDEISWFGVNASDFVAELLSLGGRDVDLHVNSPGGDVFDGLAILNTIRAYPGRVVAYVDGIAASAASFLVMGADEVVMQPNTELMIHDAWGMCLGNSADMRDMAERLDKVSDNIASIYAEKANGDVTEWRNRMRDEVWYSPDEALNAGLIDRVGGRAPDDDATLAFDLSKLRNKNSATSKSSKTNDDEFEWFDPSELLGAFEEATK